MKMEFEKNDIETFAKEIVMLISPLLSRKSQDSDDDVLDVNGLTAYLKASPRWIYERTHLKAIPHIKTGGQLRFRRRTIDNRYPHLAPAQKQRTVSILDTALNDKAPTQDLRVSASAQLLHKKGKQAEMCDLVAVQVIYSFGAPGVIRTPGTRFRKPLLYPPELQGRFKIVQSS
jgi:hypothetical protein